MGTVSFLRSAYAILWFLLLLGLGGLVWWKVFLARAPESLGPVNPAEVKTEALGAAEAMPGQPQAASERPEPTRAYLDEAELSVASPDGSMRLELKAREAEKEGGNYRLKQGQISFREENTDKLELTISDGTYLLESGVAYIEGSLSGRIPGTSQRFEARRLRWSQTSNAVLAEAVRLHGDNFSVSGERMRIQLPDGLIEFEGPVTATLSDML